MKQQFRSQKLLERLQHHPEKKATKDLQIVQKIKRLSLFKKAVSVCLYLPIHGEVDLTRIFFAATAPKKKLILPRVKGKSLDLHVVKSVEQTSPGSFNILEPQKHLPKIKPEEIDLVLVPGVVFSENGHRVGYGKGFYDRLLKKTRCPKIGIAYGFQIVKNIPGAPHDVPMDMIITESKTLKVKRKKPAAA